jgi:hypothetical protein
MTNVTPAHLEGAVGALERIKFFSAAADSDAVARDVADELATAGFATLVTPTADGGVLVSVRNETDFPSVRGHQTALTIELARLWDGTGARVTLGVWGMDTLPPELCDALFWPLVFARVWANATATGLEGRILVSVERHLASQAERAAGPLIVARP